jgi:hypothetical protein
MPSLESNTVLTIRGTGHTNDEEMKWNPETLAELDTNDVVQIETGADATNNKDVPDSHRVHERTIRGVVTKIDADLEDDGTIITREITLHPQNYDADLLLQLVHATQFPAADDDTGYAASVTRVPEDGEEVTTAFLDELEVLQD